METIRSTRFQILFFFCYNTTVFDRCCCLFVLRWRWPKRIAFTFFMRHEKSLDTLHWFCIEWCGIFIRKKKVGKESERDNNARDRELISCYQWFMSRCLPSSYSGSRFWLIKYSVLPMSLHVNYLDSNKNVFYLFCFWLNVPSSMQSIVCVCVCICRNRISTEHCWWIK